MNNSNDNYTIMGEKNTKFFNRDANGPTSGNINRISYYESTKMFEVKFKNSAIYQYEDVPLKVWESALTAPSIGRFMTQEIKGVYAYKKM